MLSGRCSFPPGMTFSQRGAGLRRLLVGRVGGAR